LLSESGAFPNRWSIIVETLATLGMGMVLVAWLWGFSALLFRKPRSNETVPSKSIARPS